MASFKWRSGGSGGSGDVVGPGSASDNAVVRFDGTTGKSVQNSLVLIDDSGNTSGIVNLTLTGTTTLATSLSGVLKAVSGVVSAATIVNADVSSSAAIAYSKLALTGSIVNADVSASAAIAYSKLALTGSILNADLAGSIAYSKLSLTGSILNADLAGSIAYSKLTLTGAILNADINASAAIALTKLAATTVSRALVSDASGFVSAATTTAAEIGFVNGVTSAIQTQLNGKQAGPLTGDVTTSGAASTLATVNSNVGSFTNANITVNGKGLITAASSGNAAPPTIQKFTSGSGTYNKDYTFVISSGNATVGATYTNNAVTFTVYATVASATQVVMSGSGAPAASGTLTKSGGTGDATLTFSQVLSPLYLKVRMVGGGGGGAGSATVVAGNATSGGAGAASTFGSSLLSAGGGAGGVANGGIGGAGGTSSLGTGPVGTALSGGYGGVGGQTATTSGSASGGNGGSSFFGGAGSGSLPGSTTPTAGVANTGGGGGGSVANTSSYAYSGSGGGAGGYVEALIYSPSATYAYAVGTAGSAGGAGTSGVAGALGGTGYIEVTEYYQ